jgi:hypothetical protein
MGALTIRADWDDEAGVWVATSNDIIGLVTEADTLEALRRKLADIVPELIAENGLRAGADSSSPIEIIARQKLAIRAA